MPSADPNYAQTVQDLQELFRQVAKELTEGRFETLHPLFGYEGDIPSEADQRFDQLSRTALEDRFIEAYDQAKLTAAEHRSLASQADFLSAVEKTLRLRGASRLQTLVQGGSRAWGVAHPEGFLARAMTNLPTMEG